MPTLGLMLAPRLKAVVGCSMSVLLTFGIISLAQALPSESKAISLTRSSASVRSASLRTSRKLFGEGIPIIVGLPNSIPQSGGFYMTVTLDSVPSAGASVKVDVSDRTHLVSPSGSWPLTVTFAPNSSATATFWVSISGTPTGSEVSSVSCKANLDISNPANWTAAASATWENLGPPDPIGLPALSRKGETSP